MKFKYRILYKKTGEEAGPWAVLTQDGKIAWWDESQGWDVDDDQSQFEVEVIK